MIQVLVDGKLCWRRTEEELKRQSESMKKTWSDPLYQKRISEIQTKRQSDPKLREQMSESCKKAWTPEMRKEVSERSSKYTHTEETRALISQKLMGHVLSYETRTQISETRLKLLKEDPTIQARASQSRKEKWEDPEYREYMYKVLPGWHFDSEGLKNLSEGHKRSYVEDPTLKERCAGMKGKTHTPETIQRMSQIRRLFWESLTPEEKVQHISKLTASWNQRPTLPEVIVNNYLQTYHIDEWSYTGKAEKCIRG